MWRRKLLREKFLPSAFITQSCATDHRNTIAENSKK